MRGGKAPSRYALSCLIEVLEMGRKFEGDYALDNRGV